MTLIKKLLIRNYKDTDRPEVRFRYGIVAGVIGIVFNLLLFGAKIAVGLIGNSLTVVADAVNNLSDSGSSVVTLFGFKLSSRPADKEHPFGHARYEYVSGLVVAFLVLAIGVLLAKSSVEKMITPEVVNVTTLTYVVLALSIGIKVFLALLNRNFGKAIDSAPLMASAEDARNDILSTLTVLIATVVIDTTGVNLDAYFGLAVSVFIVVSAVKLIRESIDPILGTRPDPDQVRLIREKLLSYPHVKGIHDLMIHNYGAANCFAVVHVEIPADTDLMEAHDMIDDIELDFKKNLGIHLTIHYDPIVTDDPELNAILQKVSAVIASLDQNLTMHDFRLVRGITHTNVLFDVVVPFECKLTRDDIVCSLDAAFVGEETKYYFVIDIDRKYEWL